MSKPRRRQLICAGVHGRALRLTSLRTLRCTRSVSDPHDSDLVKRYRGMVVSIAEAVDESISAPLDRDELVADGMRGLVEAHRRFDPTRGFRFSTFAYYRVRGAVLDGIRARAPVRHGAIAATARRSPRSALSTRPPRMSSPLALSNGTSFQTLAPRSSPSTRCSPTHRPPTSCRRWRQIPTVKPRRPSRTSTSTERPSSSFRRRSIDSPTANARSSPNTSFTAARSASSPRSWGCVDRGPRASAPARSRRSGKVSRGRDHDHRRPDPESETLVRLCYRH